MQIRDRIKDFRRVRGDALHPNPRNWRTHPRAQQDAMRGVLAEIGYADALVARQRPDGSLELLDGHLRAKLTPDEMVPVLVVDVTEAEAAKLLATLDPLAAMAETDAAALGELVADVQTGDEAVRGLLDSLVEASRGAGELGDEPLADVTIAASYQVVVQCDGEPQQRAVFERLTAEGFKCRVLSL